MRKESTMADTVAAVEIRKTGFDSERLAFHEQMAGAYHGFLHYALVANAVIRRSIKA